LYQHGYDDIIVRGIRREEGERLNFGQIHRLLCESYPGVSVSETTVSKHLKLLEKEEILKHKKESYNRYNQTYYSLTDAAKLELDLFDSFRPVRARTKPITELKQRLVDDYERKACLLTLLRAASGTYLPRIVNKPVPGGVAIYNQTTRKYESLRGEKVDGVLHHDIVAHNDMMSLFRDVDFTRSKDYVEILQTEFGLRDAIEEVVRRGNNGEIVKGIKIADNHVWLKEFLVLCECMLSWVEMRMSQSVKIRLMNALYKDGSLTAQHSSIPLDSFRIYEREACKWYIDTFGRKAFNRLYNNCRKLLVEKTSESDIESRNKRKRNEIRKFIREDCTKRKNWIKQWDKTIIAFYHGLYKCDRLVPDSPWGSGVDGQRMYNAYRHYVRKVMPKEYHYLMGCLSEMLYPEFLQKQHGNDPELKQFVQSLPARK